MNKRFSAKARDSVMAGWVDTHISDGNVLMNALEFIESPGGLNVELYPVQRVIIKLIFGIPMDWQEKEVPIYDKFCDELLYTFKETEYIHYVHEQGRINIPDWQSARPDGYNEIDMIVGRRGGKAFEINELVPTPTGMKKIGDLVAGDYVFSPTGLPVRVAMAHEPFVDKTFRVHFDDGTHVLAHGGHLWHTYTRADRKAIGRNLSPTTAAKRPQTCRGEVLGAVKTTDEIARTLRIPRKDGKFEINHSIPLTSPIELPEAPLPLDPYFLGVWLGDGSNYKVGITTADIEIADYTRKIASEFDLNVRTEANGSKATTYVITSGRNVRENPVLRILQSLNVMENKHVPESYLWASRTQRLALLQGLMDTDGSCTRSRCEFTNTSKSLTQGVYQLAASLGLKPHFAERRAKLNGKDCGPCWRVSWTATLPVFRLQRKLDKLPAVTKSCQNHRFITQVDEDVTTTVRCITVDSPDGLFLFGTNFNITHNSAVVGAVAAYKLYLLLNHPSPQDYYGLVPGSPIDLTMMAQDSAGSSRLYNQLKNYVNKAPFFAPFVKGMTSDEMTFVSESDRVNRDITPSIKASAHPCTTNAVRGPSSYFLALDEFAFYRNQIGSNSDEMYEAATPATMQFKAGGTREGKRESMIFIITSPGNRIGKYYTLFKSAMEQGASSPTLAFQCSTAEMNPRSDVPFLKDQYKQNPEKFMAEYGGQFLEASESFVKGLTITECVDTDRGNVEQLTLNQIGHKHFWGLDLGMKHDATALAVCHWEGKNNTATLIYDYIGRLMVGEAPYENYKELPLDDILNWLKSVNNMLPCYKGATDQYGGSMLVQLLLAHEIYGMELVHLTGGINSQMYLTLKSLMENRQVRYPNVPKFVAELRLLEATFTNKYQIRVAAPEEKGAHDDMADAAALAAHMAQTWAIGDGKREIIDIMQGIPQNVLPGTIQGGWDMNASLAHLRSYERQLQMQLNPRGAVLNPWRRR